MRNISFLFIGEGKSDSALVDHLRDLCVLCGADEVQGIAPDLSVLPKKVGHSVKDKLEVAIKLEPNANLLFIHRDADSVNAQPRHDEIRQAIEALSVTIACIAVVPIQETEAWLLLDEQAIRLAADNPRGRIPLNIPSPSNVENLANPKERLWDLLCTASELTGRKLDKFNKSLERRRRTLLERLDPEGPVREVPAWQRLCNDLHCIINTL